METVKDEELLTLISENKEDANSVYLYSQVVHGTTRKVLNPIMEQGLCKMARNNIHMAIGLPGKNGVISGMRNSCDTIVEINLLKAVKSGRMPFYTSTNNVVLTPGEGEKGLVPPEFFRSVFDANTNQYLY